MFFYKKYIHGSHLSLFIEWDVDVTTRNTEGFLKTDPDLMLEP